MAGTPHSNPQNKKKPSRKQCAHKQYSDKFKQKIVDKFKFHKSHNPKLTVTDFAKLVNIKYTTVNPWIKKQNDLDKSLQNPPAQIPPAATSIPTPTSPNPTTTYPGSYKDAFKRHSNFKRNRDAVDLDVEQKLYDWFCDRKNKRIPVLFSEVQWAYQVFHDEKYPNNCVIHTISGNRVHNFNKRYSRFYTTWPVLKAVF